MHISATEAKNRFGYVCTQAKRAPVFVEKGGRVESVILSAEEFASLNARAQSATTPNRKAAFETEYSSWLEEADARFDAHGSWCDDVRVW